MMYLSHFFVTGYHNVLVLVEPTHRAKGVATMFVQSNFSDL